MVFTAGDRVIVRGERWIVQEATSFADSTILSLSSADDLGVRQTCRLLTPFDRPSALPRNRVIRATSARRWMHHLRAHRSASFAFEEIVAPQRAAIDILPFQLEPVLALVRGHASRFLLADEVGLGKTIQAGLILAELGQRGWCEHALIVTPAGLRQQWTEELNRRFDIRAVVVDAASLAAAAASLPFGVNPWAVEPVVITSMDFLKQPEVLQAPAALLWDVVIVDEAHHAAVGSLRYGATAAVAAHARHVILLTATPHTGDERAYRGLCGIGEVEHDPVLLFRRTRESSGLPRSRRVHLLPVSLTPASGDMHRLLNAYLERLWNNAQDSGRHDLQLIAVVLGKRAFSSARSLAASLERRIAGLAGRLDGPAQSSLPFDFEIDESDDARLPALPAFHRVAEEVEILHRLLGAARQAQMDDRKMRAIQRIVQRVSEPLIVFTEYRDTIDAIAEAIGELRTITTLHGGQSAAERRHSVRAFTRGAADVMIATDAGSEGLNLQGTCRLVVNLELPWNPIRLEQRIGRVDRIGQRRTVHAINLLAEGTAERTVLANLLRRIDRIRHSEIEIAACVISQSQPPPRPAPAETCTQTIDLACDARAVAEHVSQARQHSRSKSVFREDVIPVTVVRSEPASLTCFFRLRFVTRTGRLVEDRLLPVQISIERPELRLGRKSARALAESLIVTFGNHLLECAREYAAQRARALASELSASGSKTIGRERAIARGMDASDAELLQPGLFDARAVKDQAAANATRDAVRRQSEERMNMLELDASVHIPREPELVLLLIRCLQG